MLYFAIEWDQFQDIPYLTFPFASICKKEDTRTVKPMDFTPEYKDEVIREAVSQKSYRPLVNPSKNVWRESNQNKAPDSPFHIGEYIIYTN